MTNASLIGKTSLICYSEINLRLPVSDYKHGQLLTRIIEVSFNFCKLIVDYFSNVWSVQVLYLRWKEHRLIVYFETLMTELHVFYFIRNQLRAFSSRSFLTILKIRAFLIPKVS